MCLQPIMVIKAICAPGHLARKRSSRCWLEPPLLATFQFRKHHQYLAKTTQVEQKKAPYHSGRISAWVVFYTHHTSTLDMEVWKSLARQVCHITSPSPDYGLKTWHGATRRPCSCPWLGCWLKMGHSGHLVSKDISTTYSFVVDVVKVTCHHPFNIGTKMPKQVNNLYTLQILQ